MNDTTSWAANRSAGPPGLWQPASRSQALRDQFNACDRLEGFVMTALNDVNGSFNRTANAVVKLAVTRALHAFDALLHLADAGYAVPALAVARTLIEETVASWWLGSASRSELEKRLRAHEQSYTLMLQGPAYPDVRYLPLLQGVTPLTAEEVEGIAKQFDVDQHLGARHWTRKSIKEMARAVRDEMDPHARETLDALIGKPLLVANLMTHNSPLSMATRLVPEDDPNSSTPGEYGTSRRPSTRLVHECLAIAYEALVLIAWLVDSSGQDTALEIQIQQDRALFVVLPPGSRARRNDPCPCESGKKFKLCHGRPGITEHRPPRQGGWQSSS